MTKQTRRLNAEKKAAAVFAYVAYEAKRITTQREQEREAWPRPKGMDDNEWDVCCAVRVMREQGMAWWQLAHALGLPGSAATVADGKAGAGYARRLYVKAFGALPEGVRANAKGSAERRAAAVGPWFGESSDAPVVLETIRRNEIEWRSRLKDGTDTAIVGDNPEMVADKEGHPVVRFNSVVYGETEKNAKGWMPGPERHVRVADILAVRPGVPLGVRLSK